MQISLLHGTSADVKFRDPIVVMSFPCKQLSSLPYVPETRSTSCYSQITLAYSKHPPNSLEASDLLSDGTRDPPFGSEHRRSTLPAEK